MTWHFSTGHRLYFTHEDAFYTRTHTSRNIALDLFANPSACNEAGLDLLPIFLDSSAKQFACKL